MSSEAAPMNPPAGGIAGLRPLLLLLVLRPPLRREWALRLWSQQPTLKVLATNLAPADLAEVTTALDQAKIIYKPEGNSILVPADKYNEAVMKTAGKGVSAAGGLANIDKDPGFGVSQFMENARYQHALQQELEAGDQSLDSVQEARVILAVPQQSAFVRDRRRVSASVTLQVACRPQAGWRAGEFHRQSGGLERAGAHFRMK